MWKHTWKKLEETETLYEVRLESPVLGSKTGKVEDQTFEKLIAWI